MPSNPTAIAEWFFTKLEDWLNSGTHILWIYSEGDEGRVEKILAEFCERTGGINKVDGYTLETWDIINGASWKSDSEGLTRDPLVALSDIHDAISTNTLLCMRDFHTLLGLAANLPLRRRVLECCKFNALNNGERRAPLVIIANNPSPHPDIKEHVTVIDVTLPNFVQMRSMVDYTIDAAVGGEDNEQLVAGFTEPLRDMYSEALLGLNASEASRILAYAIASNSHRPKSLEVISDEKAISIRKIDGLTFIPKRKIAGATDIGGFDSFMQFLHERKHAYSKHAHSLKMERPRGCVLIGPPGPQPLDAAIRTPWGWTAMGKLTPGAVICAPDGTSAAVLKVYELGMQPVYTITLDDGTTVRATAEHHWPVHHKRYPNDYRLCRTSDLRGGGKRRDRPHWFGGTKIDGNAVELPLHPYVLGALLGNGHFRGSPGAQLTDKDGHVARGVGQFVQVTKRAPDTTDNIQWSVHVTDQLKQLELWEHLAATKFVPAVYLSATYDDRLLLLAGLMDTDGRTGPRGKTQFSSTSKTLADNVVELVRSLGGKAYVSDYVDDRHDNQCYIVRVLTPFNPYRNNLADASRWKPQKIRRYVQTVVKGPSEPVRCILLDHPEHLYVTNGYVPTHNTGKTVAAKIAANVLNLDLVMLDIGSMFQGIVGQSEQKMRSTLATVAAMKNVVLMIDEIDKALAGAHKSQASDSGVASRVLSYFLSWLSNRDMSDEDDNRTFVLVTMNRTDGIPPEMLRAGRFDRIFATDLPTKQERIEILAIHLKKRGLNPADFDLDTLAADSNTKDFAGGDLEEVIVSGRSIAFGRAMTEWERTGGELPSLLAVKPSVDDLLEVAKGIKPMAVLDPGEIEKIREFCKNRAVSVSAPAAVAPTRTRRVGVRNSNNN